MSETVHNSERFRCVIDVGSNTIKSLRAKISSGSLSEIKSSSRAVRLAEGFIERKEIRPQAMLRAEAALKELFAELLDSEKDSLIIVATAAVREASNQNDFLQMAQSVCSKNCTVLSGKEEARLSILGASQALKATGLSQSEVLFVDHGGASTEIASVQPQFFSHSFPIGAVRAFELLDFEEGVISDELWTRRFDVFDEFFERQPIAQFDQAAKSKTALLVVGGTLVQMAIAMGAKLCGHDTFMCTRSDTKEFLEKVRKVSIEERENVIKIEHGRADILPAGGSLLEYFLMRFGVEKFFVTTWGLRHGVLIESARGLN